MSATRRTRNVTQVDSLTPHLFAPGAGRPVRAKLRNLHANTLVRPHCHAYAQLALSTTGVIRLTVPHGSYLVPPSRALWIPPEMEHAVTLVDDADLRLLYFYQPAAQAGPWHAALAARAGCADWQQCRVLEVSPLLRELVQQLPITPDDAVTPDPAVLQREQHLGALVCDELWRASSIRLGVDLPRDKRLRQLCEAVLADPVRHVTLEQWAHNSGASARTVARLFRQELNQTFGQWRQQVLLEKAVALAAGGMAVGRIALELGYTPSAFSAMVRRAVGEAPARFLLRQG